MKSFLLFSMLLFSSPFLAQEDLELAYISKKDGNFEIYRCNLNGTNHQRLTYNPGFDWSPKWNDGLNGILYYTYDTLGEFKIKLMDTNGQEKPLDTYGLDEIILSPDGEKILYTQKEGEYNFIFLFDRVSKSSKKIIDYPCYNGRPDWSPKGDSFTFISDREGKNELYLYDLTTNFLTRLTHNDLREKYTAWSPDGGRIALTLQPEGKHEDIFLLTLSTGELIQITNNDYPDVEIDWSPDGRKIAFHSTRNQEDHLYTINIDGTGEQQITHAKAYHGEPEWIKVK